jgi:hypothetical protein
VDKRVVKTAIAVTLLALAMAVRTADVAASPAARVGGAAYDPNLILDWQPDQTRSGKPLITGYVKCGGGA